MMNVCEAIGYAAGLGESIALKRRSGGTVILAAAAEVDASVGATKLPLLFFTLANVKLFCSAWACSTYPTDPGVCLIVAATPLLPFAPMPVGHLTSLLEPT